MKTNVPSVLARANNVVWTRMDSCAKRARICAQNVNVQNYPWTDHTYDPTTLVLKQRVPNLPIKHTTCTY